MFLFDKSRKTARLASPSHSHAVPTLEIPVIWQPNAFPPRVHDGAAAAWNPRIYYHEFELAAFELREKP